MGGGFPQELDLSEELRSQLGLQEGESLRLLHSAARTLLLERVGGGGSETAIPWDRDLVLAGDVCAFPMADLLSMIHGMGKSGFLYFGHGECEKSVYLHRGEVIFAASNQKVDRLGNSLLHDSAITLAQLQEAERWEPTGRFGKLLVERGMLSPRELWNGVKRQVEEIVRSLFAYTAGQFYFWEGEIQPDNVVRLSLPTRRLISEGLRRRDELLKLLAQLEDSRTRLAVTESDSSERSSNDRVLLEEVRRDGFFPDVCHRAGIDPLSGARMVQMLCAADAVRLTRMDQVEEADEVEASGDDDVRECVVLHVKVISELAAPIVAVEGQDGVGERLTRVAEEVASRYPALLDGISIGAGGISDADALTERVLRHPGDRLRVVSDALGEIVSYLEFELKNHPRIEDPEIFLDAIETLRANLS